MSSRRSRSCLAMMSVLLVTVSACSVGHKAVVGSATPSTQAATPTPTPTPTPSDTPSPTPAAAVVNPLTGMAPVPAGPVVAVKIDDTSNGRPQRSIDLADIVYIEQAEGGLSRLVAVFATNKPVVEAVRSVRASDPELLSQYGPITLVASGGGGDALPTLYSSILHAVIDDRGDKGFSRDSSRGQPYNLTSNLAIVSADVPGSGVKSIGFQWTPVATPVAGAAAATNVQTKVGSTSVNFVWDAPTAHYIRVINGVRQHAADGSLISTPNVIVQFCTVTANPNDVDVNGAVSQYTHSIGSGQVVVFSNGQRINGTWSRSAATDGTTLTSTSGAPILLTPGGAWVALVATGAPITSS